MDATLLDARGPCATVRADVTHDTGTVPTGLGVPTEDLASPGVTDDHRVPAELGTRRVGNSAAVVVPRSAVRSDVPVAAVLRCTDDSTPS